MLFESLNNRGVPLSAADLIKNILIASSEQYNKVEDNYEKLIKHDFNTFLNNLIKEAKIYSTIINNSNEEKIYKINYLI